MRNKFIPLFVALVFGSVAAVGFTKMMKASPKAETVEIFVAVRDINVAEELTQESIRLAHWPAAAVPRDAILDWKAMEGKFASQRLYAEEPIVLRKLMDSKDTKTVDIPKGFNVVTLKTDEASSVANLVSPGDRVNVIGFFTKSDVVPATTTRTVLSGVKVFAVDGRTSREEDEEAAGKAARTVSLLIHAGDAEAWTCAKELGKISLSLGRPDDGDTSPGEPSGPNTAGQEFLAWLAAHQEAKNREAEPKASPLRFLSAIPTPIAPPTVITPPAPAAPAVKEEPELPAAPAEPAAPAVSHRMVKIGPEGQMQVFTWIEGNPIPQISSGEPGVAPAGVPSPSTNLAPSSGSDAASPLDYLHGEESPLYAPTEQPTS
ncbi:Flp pilus assembly protein CpaB [Candidatus Laterigemmans baculatus]|uniref:Flp pilus assembly protein CpaB n=1 Tax=Candidatus Laterigemmans baculatus TaxID=2770505 RepID=UPI0013DC7C0D|nr:Flp pilus assembly protein CpaB [Candidatus Laterigemmans baculatus]